MAASNNGNPHWQAYGTWAPGAFFPRYPQMGYLAGVHPVPPPPNGPQQAVANLYARLDGQYQEPDALGQPPAAPQAPARVPAPALAPDAPNGQVAEGNEDVNDMQVNQARRRKEQAITSIDVYVTDRDGAKVPRSFSLQLDPVDFRDQLAMCLGGTLASVKMGYKFPARGSELIRLATDDDVVALRSRWVQWRAKTTANDPRVTIVDMNEPAKRTTGKRKHAPAPNPLPPNAAPPDPTKEAAAAPFKTLRDKLQCKHTNSTARFCFTEKDSTVHTELDLDDLGLIARLWKNDPDNVDPTFTALPDIKRYMDRIEDNRMAKRKQPTPRRATSNTVPPVQVYVNTGAGEEGKDRALAPRALRKDDSVLDLDATPIPIHDVLNILQAKMPECDYLAYTDGLKRAGFHYASQVLDNRDDTKLFAEAPVSMPHGMIRTFVKGVRGVVEEAKRDRLAAERRVEQSGQGAEKENVVPDDEPEIVVAE